MKQRHLLIVEDNKLFYDRLKNKLSKENFSIAPFAPSVAEALNHIHNKRPDLALLDINLEGEQTGIDLGKILYEQYKIPFIYVTELDSDYAFYQALQTKHKDYITKAVAQNDFKEILRAIYTTLAQEPEHAKKASKGMEALVDYLDNIKIMGLNQVSRKPVDFEDIIYFSLDDYINNDGVKENLQANYIWLWTKTGERLFLKISLTDLYEKLPDFFVRINIKTIININYIEGIINGAKILVAGKDFKITPTYKNDFIKRYRQFFSSL